MIEPSYQELVSSEIPSAKTDGVTVKIIAGRPMGIESPVRTRTPTSYLDFKFSPQATFTQDVSKSWTCFVYILEGKFRFNGSKEIEAHNTVLFNNDGEGVQMENIGSTEGHLVLIAGEPISKNFVFRRYFLSGTFAEEPVVQHGPFVMNTRAEIEQAFEDYQLGQNGFEKVKTWKSIEGNK